MNCPPARNDSVIKSWLKWFDPQHKRMCIFYFISYSFVFISLPIIIVKKFLLSWIANSRAECVCNKPTAANASGERNEKKTANEKSAAGSSKCRFTRQANQRVTSPSYANFNEVTMTMTMTDCTFMSRASNKEPNKSNPKTHISHSIVFRVRAPARSRTSHSEEEDGHKRKKNNRNNDKARWIDYNTLKMIILTVRIRWFKVIMIIDEQWRKRRRRRGGGENKNNEK